MFHLKRKYEQRKRHINMQGKKPDAYNSQITVHLNIKAVRDDFFQDETECAGCLAVCNIFSLLNYRFKHRFN